MINLDEDIVLIKELKGKIDKLADKYYDLQNEVDENNKRTLEAISEELEKSYLGLRKSLIQLNKLKYK